MKHCFKLFLALLALSTSTFAQQGMGVGNNNPLEMLDVSGAIKVGTDNNNSNAAPTGGAGTIRFKAGAFQGWDGTFWIPLGGGADTDWTVSGNNQYSAVSGRVGIGTNSPNQKVHMHDAAATWLQLTSTGSGTSAGDGVILGLSSGNEAQLRVRENWPLVFMTNDTEQMRVANNGNVGIGTTTPLAKLDVTGGFDGAVLLRLNTARPWAFEENGAGTFSRLRLRPETNTKSFEIISQDLSHRLVEFKAQNAGSAVLLVPDGIGNAGIGTTNAQEKLHVQGNIRMVDGNEQAGYIPVSDANGTMTWTNPLTITTADDGDWTINGNDIYNANSGNVGIGTTSPNSKLTVSDPLSTNMTPIMTVNSTGNQPLLVGETANNTGLILGYDGNDIQGRSGAGLSTYGDLLLNRYGGNVGIGIQNPATKLMVLGVASNPTIPDYTSTAVFRVAVNPHEGIDFGKAGNAFNYAGWIQSGYGGSADPLSLQPVGGNVGIGNTNPQDKLHVTGSIRMVDGNQQAGFIPVSDANGTMTWTNPTGISGSPDEIVDADGDTKIQVEEIADEDIIRFDMGGTEFFTMDNGRLNVLNTGNSVFMGEGAGANDDLSNNRNVFIGNGAGNANTIGEDNTANGYSALYSNLSGYYNVANGSYALYSNTNGWSNVANGYSALYSNTSGEDNVANGYSALYSNISGDFNTANGTTALYSNTNGFRNVANGFRALYSNASGNNNTANGNYALYNNTTGNSNTANGSHALSGNTTGGHNTANGYNALRSNNTGQGVTAIGYQAGYANNSNPQTTGNYNTYIGYFAGLGSSTQRTNATAIGYMAKVEASNALVLGGTGADAVNVGIGTTSPTDNLHVEGSIRMVDGNQAIGYVPVSDASGKMTWTDPTTISDGDWTVSGNNQYSAVSGDVGIGTNSPNQKVHVHDAAATWLQLTNTGSGTSASDGVLLGLSSGNEAQLRVRENWPLVFLTNDTEKMRVASNGNVGIGTSMPSTILSLDGNANRTIAMERTTGTDGFDLTIQAGGAKAGTPDNDGGNLILSGGTATGNGSVVPKSNIIFQTATQLGSSSSADQNPTEKMRVTANGKLGLGTTNPQAKFHVTDAFGGTAGVFVARVENTGNGAYSNGLEIKAGQNTQSVNNRFISFVRPNGTEIGAVRQVTSASVDYNTTSDERLKTNINPTTKGLNDLMQIQVKDYLYKEDMDKPQTGFIAQQVYEHYPNAVSVGGDDVKTDPWMMDYGKMTPLLVKAIQDQQEMIQALQTEVQALKEQLKNK